ncbi:MAG: sulfurtransferase [Actinobacteria bacterium]|nr:sulfurtransferase [Actinomycetota bacterium]
MSVSFDTSDRFSDFAHPEALVSTDWLRANLETPGLVVIECDEDVLLYETGHVPGAVKLDWHTELNDSVVRDYLSPEDFADLMRRKGISRDDTLLIYGDKSNWWATYALWVFKLYGHGDVRILDGGRDKWIAEALPLTTEKPVRAETEYPVVTRDDESIRAFLSDTLSHIGKPMIDVRSPEEFSGERTHMPSYPEEGALRGGHIPGAANVPWARAVNEDGTFKSRSDLEATYMDGAGLRKGDDIIAYCRIGERSSHSWFVLTYLLGFEGVRNYDGSWTEWGSAVRVPIEKGATVG